MGIDVSPVANARATVPESAPNAKYEVDGLSGATLTTNGIDAMIRFWIGPEAFGKYLSNVRAKGDFNG